jgi:hypothetical protein
MTTSAMGQPKQKVDATPREDKARAGDSMPARELLEEVMLARLSRELKLTETETVLMVRRYSDFREAMQQLRAERDRLARQLRQALKEDAADGVLTPLMAEIRAVDEEMALARMTIYDEISADLDTKQKARLYLFIGEFEAQLRRWLNEAWQRRTGGEPPAGGLGEGGRPFGPLFRRGAQPPPPQPPAAP